MSAYSAKEYEILFDQTAAGCEVLQKGITLYRTKTVKCGEFVYVSSYPIWDTKAEASKARELKEKRKTSEAQKRLNQRNAQRRLEQIVNANFTTGDIYQALTYSQAEQPADDRQARRDVQNYIRRLRAARAKAGLSDLRYVYVTEITESEKHGRRYHHHIIMSGDGMSRDAIEALWKKGLANTRRCQYQEGGLAGIAVYISKSKATQTKMGRRWNRSKNLKEPRETTADHKISRRKVDRIAAAIADDGRRIFEKAYPGYRVIDEIEIKRSDYVAGAYIYVKMRRG